MIPFSVKDEEKIVTKTFVLRNKIDGKLEYLGRDSESEAREIAGRNAVSSAAVSGCGSSVGTEAAEEEGH